MFKIILGIILGLVTVSYWFSLEDVQIMYPLQAIPPLIEGIMFALATVWLIQTGRKERKLKKEGKIVEKMKFSLFAKELFGDIVAFNHKYAKQLHPPYWLLMLWIFGMAHLHNVHRLSVIGNPAMADINTWQLIWPMVILMGVFWGAFLYYGVGFIFYGFIRLFRGQTDFRTARNILLYSNIYLYLAVITGILINTLLYGDGYFYGEINGIVNAVLMLAILGTALFSFWKLCTSVVSITGVNKKGAFVFSILIPLMIVVLLGWTKQNALFLSRGGISNDQAINALRQGDAKKAEEFFNETISQLKKEGDGEKLIKAYINKGIAYEFAQNLSAAKATYEEGLREAPADSSDHFVLQGLLYLLEGKIKEAEDALNKSLAMNPDDFNANNRLGLIYMGRYDAKIKDLEAALTYNQKAYALNAEDPSAVQNLAINYYDLGRYQEALPLFEALVKIIPGNILSKYLLGMTYHKLGDEENAKILLKEATTVNPQLLTEEIKKILEE